MKKLYCIEIERELDGKMVKHKMFNDKPTRDKVLQYVENLNINYDDNYEDFSFYEVKQD